MNNFLWGSHVQIICWSICTPLATLLTTLWCHRPCLMSSFLLVGELGKLPMTFIPLGSFTTLKAEVNLDKAPGMLSAGVNCAGYCSHSSKIGAVITAAKIGVNDSMSKEAGDHLCLWSTSRHHGSSSYKFHLHSLAENRRQLIENFIVICVSFHCCYDRHNDRLRVSILLWFDIGHV